MCHSWRKNSRAEFWSGLVCMIELLHIWQTGGKFKDDCWPCKYSSKLLGLTLDHCLSLTKITPFSKWRYSIFKNLFNSAKMCVKHYTRTITLLVLSNIFFADSLVTSIVILLPLHSFHWHSELLGLPAELSFLRYVT